MKPIFSISKLLVLLCAIALFISLAASWQLIALEQVKDQYAVVGDARIAALNTLVAGLLVMLLGMAGIIASKRLFGKPVKSRPEVNEPDSRDRLPVVNRLLQAGRDLGLASEDLSYFKFDQASAGELHQAVADLKSTAQQIENIISTINNISE